MIKVSVFYWSIYDHYGKDVAAKFMQLMKEWDGLNDVSNAYYDEDLLEMKLKEAQEITFKN
jgi:hypothetical protein